MNLVEKLEQIPIVSKTEVSNRPSFRHLGVDYLGERIGGCSRALWYRFHNIEPTNPSKPHLKVAIDVDEQLKEMVRNRLSKSIYGYSATPLVKELDNGVSIKIDTYSKDEAVVIHCGSGYGFRADVFGTKYKEGGVKDADAVEAWAILSYLPQFKKVSMLYVDRGMLDMIVYEITSSLVSKEELDNDILAAKSNTIAPMSYEKQWTDPIKVAELYADKKITKAKYEEFKNTGEGCSWQCSYCLYLSQCSKDEK